MRLKIPCRLRAPTGPDVRGTRLNILKYLAKINFEIFECLSRNQELANYFYEHKQP